MKHRWRYDLVRRPGHHELEVTWELSELPHLAAVYEHEFGVEDGATVNVHEAIENGVELVEHLDKADLLNVANSLTEWEGERDPEWDRTATHLRALYGTLDSGYLD
jgi:hypothetical protein